MDFVHAVTPRVGWRKVVLVWFEDMGCYDMADLYFDDERCTGIQNWEVMEKLLEDQYGKSAGARCDRAARCGVPA
jgi:hypothetical protein